ncbi:hypothetical protein E3P81_00835 [Wallemia ichthyophaga]|nr:hypothetical protein E3P91_00666 [Wallemia ichthyophaga]TIA83653.1 hypothetical protein E3P98_00658 [Wallemia ichthyophaga]TIA93679.1 hypothetical protein E3P97_00836 [Wallemia ichthyophaga]TIB02668.1 hypothetical protein E3P95_00884 [Wallemia ichthyophaga]TIB03574.1 hypothetical protein E3P94_01016 [Wallemia ichthyophaga]
MKKNLILNKLPNELLIDIATSLPLDGIFHLSLTCKALHQLVRKHQEIIYHSKCIELGFAGLHTQLNQLNTEIRKRDFLSLSINSISDWKQYCLFTVLQNNLWPSRCLEPLGTIHHLDREDCSVWRVKVDTKLKLFIYTSTLGGLLVKSAQDPHTLLDFNRTVSPFAHLEYYKENDSEGYASTHGSRLDIWKVSKVAGAVKLDHVTQVNVPFTTRASRMKYGVLSVAAANGSHIGLIDPKTGELTRVINTIPSIPSMRMIGYIEQTANEILICRGSTIEIYSKLDGSLVAKITSESIINSTYFLDKEDIAQLSSEDVIEGFGLSFQNVAILNPQLSNDIGNNDNETNTVDYSRNYNMLSIDEDEALRDGIPIRDDFNGVNRALEMHDENEEIDIFDALNQNLNWDAVHVDANKLVAYSSSRIMIVNDYAQTLNGTDSRMLIQLPSTTDDEPSPMCFEHSRMIFVLGGRLSILPLHEDVPSVIHISHAHSDDPPSALQATEDAVILTSSEEDDTYDWPHCQKIRWLDLSPPTTFAD